MIMANIETLRILGRAIARRDHDTGSHDSRVTLYAVRLAEAIGVDDQTMRHLIMGAFLHDVGKIAVPDRILLKAGSLSPEEWELMKSHVTMGVEILAKCKGCGWMHEAIEVVRFHHERFDGTGYPSGCAALAIPLNARIFSIADVFDALASARPYKDRIPFGHAMKEMGAQRNRHFDPDLFDAFCEVARELYDRYADEDDETLASEVDHVIARYFADGTLDNPMPGCMSSCNPEIGASGPLGGSA
jgi:putative nucleotidyltransferase with HDIG domain